MKKTVKFDTIIRRLALKSTPKQGLHGCCLWNGPVYDRRITTSYGRCRNPFQCQNLNQNKKSHLKVHKLLYMCMNHVTCLPENMEVSHLCHNKLCIRSDHLVLETHAQNMMRITCKNNGWCTEAHGGPTCLL